ncbi:Fe(3+)-hydroxamate ABC transporter permease FhuB [Tistrella mobilis]|uniref:Fe(3+)-hydroxamate ABC transporter permease FhuB n=1 Tax=Tistrella mobilis TaxID=171437 RepID=UPI003556CF74
MITPRRRPPLLVLLAVTGFAIAALLLIRSNLADMVSPALWPDAVLTPDPADTMQVLAHYAFLPRVSVALLAGAGLAMAGAMLQYVLRNPLAEPATLGISAGAQLALTIATLHAPWAFAIGREGVALLGAALAFCLVLGLSAARGLSPVSVTLAGLIVSLFCGMAAAVVTLFNHDLLIGLFLWGAGYLDQGDWQTTRSLVGQVLPLALLALLLIRPITLLGLDDRAARGLGLNVAWFRLAAMGAAVALTAVIVAAVGIISFIGLAAPAIARLAGARRPVAQLVAAPVIGALLLLITDQLVLLLPTTYRAFPTGAMTAILGAPLLLILLPRLAAAEPPVLRRHAPVHRAAHPWRLVALIAGLTLIVFAGALLITGDATGPVAGHWGEILAYRLPRALAAFAGGLSLAIAGTILQRMTGNPLAAPEVLGISSGAMLGIMAVMFLAASPTRPLQIAGGAAGAVLMLALILALTRRQAFSGLRLLLAGIAMGSITGLVVAVLKTFQDPRLGQLLAWLSGSTYATSMPEALLALGLGLAALALTPLMLRWLHLLPLGHRFARTIGMSVARVNAGLLLLVALLSASATILVGPLAFVGIMGPHFARLAGLVRPAEQLVGAALFGGLTLLAADWAGRVVIFPYQIPAGLLAALIGGPVLLLLIGRRA